MRFALSIQQEYEFLRSPVSIYYEIKNLKPVSRIRHGIKRYTPDFLIRHKQTLEAFWIEIKPLAYAGNQRLDLCRKVAENYIRWKKHDWKYKVVFDDGICLTDDQQTEFTECIKTRKKAYSKYWLETKNKPRAQFIPPVISVVPDNRLIEFVMFGLNSS